MFSLGVTILCACVAGLLPAYRAAHSDLHEAIRSGGAGVTASRAPLRMRQALVGCEVALSTALVFLAALLIASLVHLLRVNKGFEEKRAAAIDVDLPELRYPDGAVWAVDAQGGTERFDGQSGVFVAEPGAMAQVSVGGSANVWALDAAGLIYQFNTQAGAWRQVPGQLGQVHAAFDGSVWGINSQGLIWRYNAVTGSWDNIPGALQSLSLGADAVVWGINAGGATYYFR